VNDISETDPLCVLVNAAVEVNDFDVVVEPEVSDHLPLGWKSEICRSASVQTDLMLKDDRPIAARL
jgi:hypothetical protein